MGSRSRLYETILPINHHHPNCVVSLSCLFFVALSTLRFWARSLVMPVYNLKITRRFFFFRLSNCGYLLETFQLNWQLYTKLRVLSLHKLECFTFLVNSMTCLLSLLISHNIPYRNRPDLPSLIKSCINPKSLQSSNPHGSYYQMNLPACRVFEHSTQFFQ